MLVAAPVLHAAFVCMAFYAMSACPAVAERYLQACPGQAGTANLANLASMVTYYLQIRRRSWSTLLCALISSRACA